jgi:hypothetical protein
MSPRTVKRNLALSRKLPTATPRRVSLEAPLKETIQKHQNPALHPWLAALLGLLVAPSTLDSSSGSLKLEKQQ